MGGRAVPHVAKLTVVGWRPSSKVGGCGLCGIVGLLVKRPALRDSLGAWLSPMLVCMGDRGPDSAGLAVFSLPVGDGKRRFSLYAGLETIDWSQLASRARADLSPDVEIESNANHAGLTTASDPTRVRGWLEDSFRSLDLLWVGRSIDLFQDPGHPRERVDRYAFARLSGTHAAAPPRMAPEPAVTPAHAHPFTAGED